MQVQRCVVNSDGVITGIVAQHFEDDGFEYRIKLRRTEYDKVVFDDFIYPNYAQPLTNMLSHLRSYYQANSQNASLASLSMNEKTATIETNIGWVEYYLVRC